MIRSNIVTLTVIPAIAFRQKLSDGGSGIVIYRENVSQPGIASISKTSGEAILTANTPAEYPKEAFEEAMELTAGMPYRRLGSVKYVDTKPVEVEEKEEGTEPAAEAAVVDSNEYQAVVDAYTDKKGKLSYDLINKDMIKFAHDSRIVQTMAEDMKSIEEIRSYVVCMKFRDITGNKDLTEAQAARFLELLDEVSVKGVLREFNEELKKKLAESKRK